MHTAPSYIHNYWNDYAFLSLQSFLCICKRRRINVLCNFLLFYSSRIDSLHLAMHSLFPLLALFFRLISWIDISFITAELLYGNAHSSMQPFGVPCKCLVLHATVWSSNATVWSSMQAFGASWKRLEFHESVWCFMQLFRASCNRLEFYANVWNFIQPFGVPYNHSWLHIFIRSWIQPLIVPYNRLYSSIQPPN